MSGKIRGALGAGFTTPLDREYTFVAMLGLFIGALVGAMAQVVPYALVLLSAIGVSLLAWRQEGGFDLIIIMMGVLVGSVFGNMGNIMPYGVTIFLALNLFAMIWRTQGGTTTNEGPTSTLAMILFIIISVGLLFNGSFQDFCNPGLVPGFDACLNPAVSGYITAYQGCVSTCTITPFTILGDSLFSYILSGNFVGFFNALVAASNSAFAFNGNGNFFWAIIQSILLGVIGAVCLIMSTGISLQADVLASGGALSVNEPGTRMFQSFGVGFLTWAALGLVFNFNAWFAYIDFGVGQAVYWVFLSGYTYELYRQGKTTFSD